MRLYSRTGATTVVDPEFGQFDADKDGGFDFPAELSGQLHGFHADGKPLWETVTERQQRLMAEESARRQDPATLLAAVEKLVQQAEHGTPPSTGKATAAASRPARKAPAAK